MTIAEKSDEWGTVYVNRLRQGDDHASAVDAADQWERRQYQTHLQCRESAMISRTQATLDPRQPIATAPRDGTHFLAYEDDGSVYRAVFDNDGVLQSLCGQPVVYSPEPIAWSPLPNLPPFVASPNTEVQP